MDSAAQDLLSEIIRQLAAAGFWWIAVALAVLGAVVIVAIRRGWLDFKIKVEPPPGPDPERDPALPPATVVDGNGRPVDLGRGGTAGDEPSGG